MWIRLFQIELGTSEAVFVAAVSIEDAISFARKKAQVAKTHITSIKDVAPVWVEKQ